MQFLYAMLVCSGGYCGQPTPYLDLAECKKHAEMKNTTWAPRLKDPTHWICVERAPQWIAR